MSEKNVLKLNDESISQIAKLVQMAILTGTDIVDNLRTLELVEEAGSLYLSSEYQQTFAANLEKMVEDAQEKTEENESTFTVESCEPSKIF